ncbi:4'-phosphopantetheinyl transferase superfamily protein [Leptolyngbya sp. FACHB-261]|uniref:4'-phosphopantetheinyl transferase family protein n=1 Tax=Leptolyngbya sp. FACHB-261 TaxID=2692806 RepID=UPI001685C7FC|nr:4'-phosphopantetheinyl transferase superfamily protein [Leptolyngbya sp. FACHB-261]MBD2103124.1 4'-phosphopantetheinyl transferase superfamily protein [Leptolyngbya sp. FACHB-261]
MSSSGSDSNFTANSVWHSPPAKLTLSASEVHVWCASLEQSASQIQRFKQTLSVDELKRAERFHFEQHRQHFIAGRGLLRTILSRYLALEPGQLQFTYGPRGKPALTAHSEEIQFNLSHAQGLALYAITRQRELGIDLEGARPIAQVVQLAQRFFSPQEYAVIQSLPGEQQQAAFLRGWTCKEAYLKAIGDGLAFPLDQVEVNLWPQEPAELVRIAGSVEAAQNWSLQELPMPTGYAAALVVKGDGCSLTCWRWPEAADL